MAAATDSSDGCPCGSGISYPACCGRYHGGIPAPTAEALMRSRYTAYAKQLADYLLATWHNSTRPATQYFNDEEKMRWLGLKIQRHEAIGTDSAIVEFTARYKIAGRAQRLHEISRFVREAGRWYYVNDQFPENGKS